MEAANAEKERKEKEDADRIERQNQVSESILSKFILRLQLKGTVQGMLKGSLKNASEGVEKKVKEAK